MSEFFLITSQKNESSIKNPMLEKKVKFLELKNSCCIGYHYLSPFYKSDTILIHRTYLQGRHCFSYCMSKKIETQQICRLGSQRENSRAWNQAVFYT